MRDPIFSSAGQLAAAIRVGSLSAREAVTAHLAQIDRHNPDLNAVVTVDAEGAARRARDADEAMARGKVRGPLHGVPFTLKDAHRTKGVRTTSGFPPLDHTPEEDGTVAARLKAAGGILLGKTNVATMLSDPAQSSNPIFGRTNNPWNVERTPGGSSGGAAAAVASGMTPFDIGTDLAGSIRIPAHFSGVFGLKPTEHRVSLAGLLPGLPPAPSVRIMSCIGPMARTIDDLALLYRIIAGPDGRDTDVEPVPVDDVPELELETLRIAVLRTLPGIPVAEEIAVAIDTVAAELERRGAKVETARGPERDLSRDLAHAGELIGMTIGAFRPERDQPPTTLAQYLGALHRRDQAIIAWEQFFERWDALLCPPSMITAFPHCEPGADLQIDGRPVAYWLINAHTTLFNYTGQPAVVLPFTVDRDGLPIGVQLVGKRWSESRLLATARALTQITGDFRRPPGY